MKPVKQTIVSAEDGNCLQACVASVLELEIDEVPHFISHGDEWWFVLQEFLAKYNITVHWLSNFIPLGAWHIASVESPRFEGSTHAIVCNPDGEYAFDPHPDIDDPSINGECLGRYWFIVSDPGKLVPHLSDLPRPETPSMNLLVNERTMKP